MKSLTLLAPLLGLLSLPAYATPATCAATSEAQIVAQFERWNHSLHSGDPRQVAALYADDAILLPTLSQRPRLTPAERIHYFEYFLDKQPSGRLDSQHVELGCNNASLSGLYTFTFAKGGESVAARYTFNYRWDGQQWLISSHHSSLLPRG
ncbi:DUF4440 domain-containing protein [Pseudomonas sp. B21-032]|uniref:DUF4440 domain-containing protein n=1 Tax=Pseudomonas sp. B21-032 TaxID=2895483 RepID=UPI0021602D2D|nr:DUF4440 domain-containing protein [Pseudomonas sp. B21-032]UVL63914.1 DUF4440 domain-containing protein [Pseudomonas sp. B21-032]